MLIKLPYTCLGPVLLSLIMVILVQNLRFSLTNYQSLPSLVTVKIRNRLILEKQCQVNYSNFDAFKVKY